MRRKRIHGKRRRRSSCKPSPLKHNILEMTHPHNQDGSHPDEEAARKADDEKSNPPIAQVDPNFDPSASYITQDDSVGTKTKTKTKSVSADDTLDNIQDALNYAGLAPGYGIIPDGINTLLSTGRAIYGLATGDYEYAKKHGKEAVVHTGSAIPLGIGQAITIGKKGIDLTKKASKLDTSYPNIIKDKTIEAMQQIADMGQPKTSKKQEIKYKPIVKSQKSSEKNEPKNQGKKVEKKMPGGGSYYVSSVTGKPWVN